MGVLTRKLRWYSIILYLVGSIISLVDPVTDILTVSKFYHAGHKTWFGVGLLFIILPCLLLPMVQLFYSASPQSCYLLYNHEIGKIRQLSFLCSCHPFSAAWANFQVLILCLKNFEKLWRGEGIDSVDPAPESNDDVATEDEATEDKEEKQVVFSKVASYVEASVESAPQFIIQLYAMVVQKEAIGTIQIISLLSSFTSILVAFTISEGLFYDKKGLFELLNLRKKISTSLLNVFFLSSRLFAITFFTVSYRWWILSVFVLRFSFIASLAAVQDGSCLTKLRELQAIMIMFFSVYWLKDATFSDWFVTMNLGEEPRERFMKIRFFSKISFVVTNVVMILLYFFSSYSDNTWYAIPVTVYVCLWNGFSALRIIYKCSRYFFFE